MRSWREGMATLRRRLWGILVVMGGLVAVFMTGGLHAGAGGDQKPLAQIEDLIITQEDLEARLGRLPLDLRAWYETEQGRIEFLRDLVRIEVFSRKAKETGLDREPRVRAHLEAVEKTLLASEYARQVAAGVTVSEEEITAFYDQHPDEFHVQEKIRAPSIMIRVPPTAAAMEVAASRARIEEARERAVRGEEFSKLVKEYSESRYAGNDDLFSRGRISPEIEDRVFSLNEGQVSPILRVHDAYLLFKLEQRRPGQHQSLDEARDKITKQLHEEKQQMALALEEERLKAIYGVEFAHQANRSTPASFRGRIISIQKVGEGQRAGRMVGWITLATSPPQPGPTMVLAVHTTTLLRGQESGTGRISFVDLRAGQEIEVKISGPISASAPPRAEADSIRVLSDKETDRN
jgi:peptidyl-prolyl cis-trans isomerase C